MGGGDEEKKQRCESGDGGKEEEKILNFLDSMDSYLILMNHLSSVLRQGWLELASARHSMGASRISSALFDLKYHNAATVVHVDQDASSSEELQHFTLCKWESSNEVKHEEDELQNNSSNPQIRHRGPSQSPDFEGQNPETNVSAPGLEDQARRERLKSLSMFGKLVSPKLRSAQVSFETALGMLVETANSRASLLRAHDEVRKGMERTET